MPASQEALAAALSPYLLMFIAFIIPVFGLAKISRGVTKATATLIQLVVFGLSLYTLLQVMQKGVITYTFAAFPPPFGITYIVDFLGAFMGILISMLFLLITPLSKHFVDDKEYFYSAMLGLEAGMLGVVYTGDIFNMFVMMEVTLISAYFLIASPRSPGSIKAAFKYAMVGTAAGMVFFLTAVMYYNALGTLNIAQGGAIISGIMASLGRALNPYQATSYIFMITLWTLIAEAALVPIHFWLPDAYSKAPPTVGALMAALSEGVAIYVMMRLFYIVMGGFTVEASVTLLVLGLISVIIGGTGMIYSKDIMKVIAYSTILDVGYMAVALSLGPTGIYIALGYILAHAIVKPTLFLSAGWVSRSLGTSNINEVKGAFRNNPAIFAGFLIGAAAVVGIPPTILFQAKFQLYGNVLYLGTWQFSPQSAFILLIMLLGSALSLAGFLRVIYPTYLLPGKSASPAPTYLKILVLLFAIGVLASGVAYWLISNHIIYPAGESLIGGRNAYIESVLNLWGG